MKLAELPAPQSASLAMCPPQARTTVPAPLVVKVIETVVLHWPVPDTSFSLT
jgi:hypothetical protein